MDVGSRKLLPVDGKKRKSTVAIDEDLRMRQNINMDVDHTNEAKRPRLEIPLPHLLLSGNGRIMPQSDDNFKRSGRNSRRGMPNWSEMRGRRHWKTPHQRPPSRPWMQQPLMKKWEPEMFRAPFPGMDQDRRSPYDIIIKSASREDIKTVTIDGLPRDIRYYEEVAIIFMNWDDPREISFQDETRRVIFNDTDMYMLNFNEPYREHRIDGTLHQVRLGGPSREIYIDYKPYECYFGGPGITIDLDGKITTIKLDGPPPQIKFGESRTDLVAGKIKLIIDAKTIIPIFVDSKVQKFSYNGEEHTVQLFPGLQSVLINNERYDVEFGGLPISVMLKDKRNNIRFSELPKTVQLGQVKIKGLETRYSTSSSQSNLRTRQLLVNPTNNFSNVQKFVDASIVPTSATNDREESKNNKKQPPLLPVSFANPEQLKVRQAAVYERLYAGLQCSDCGMRFSPEQTWIYSQHLDWHFRQNRKIKKMAFSRKWYCSTSEWNKYEEIENLDEREKNFFDLQKQAAARAVEKAEIPSAIAGPEFQNFCNVCGDEFEVFFHEDKEEWHLKNAVREDDDIYHPICFQEHQQFLLKKTQMEYDAEEKQKTNVQSRRPGIQIALDVDEEAEKTDDIVDVRTEQRENLANPTNNFNPSDTNDPFQKVVAAGLVPTSATTPVKSVSPCLNDNQNNREESRNDNKQNEKHPLLKPVSLDESKLANTDEKKEEPVEYEDEDDDVILIEETIEQIDLDDYDDKIEDEEYSLTYSPASTVVLSPKAEQDEIMDDGFVDVEEGLLMLQKGGVDVKIEPIDDGYAEGEEPMEDEPEESLPHSLFVSSMDGNLEMDTSVPNTVNNVRGNIKINIHRPLPVIPPRNNNKARKEDISLDIGTLNESVIDPSQPLPPGTEPNLLKLKPALQGVKLKKMPKVRKGSEDSSLCAIM